LRGESVAGLPERAAPHLTRRGSLAYYLAAWVCGVFFFSFVRVLAQPSHGDFPLALLMAFFVSAAVAWPALLLFGFLLRRAARIISLGVATRWIAIGGALAILFGAAFLPFQGMPAISFRSWFNIQARLFTLNGLSESSDSYGWTINTFATALAGMATGFVLFRVEKAFSAAPEASN
jgi:hypothetical protein